MFQIEKGVPMPHSGRRKKGVADSLRAMDLGDMFRCSKQEAANAYTTGKRIGLGLKTRKINRDEYGVWRVA